MRNFKIKVQRTQCELALKLFFSLVEIILIYLAGKQIIN